MARSNAPSGNESVLAEAVSDLSAEVRVLRQAIDELREEVQWIVRNALHPDRPGSLPGASESSADAAEPVHDDEADHSTAATITVDGRQFTEALQSLVPTKGGDPPDKLTVDAAQFAAAMENVDALVYCCATPKLEWFGDPEHPGIGCGCCGFLVASEGDIECWQDQSEEVQKDEIKSAKPDSSQRELF